MPAYLRPLCRYAPYLGLALLGILGWVDTTTMIVMAVFLIATWPAARRRCWPARGA